MRALCFVPDVNSPGKKDVTGAFYPEALAFTRHHRLSPAAIVRFPARSDYGVRRQACTRAIRSVQAELDVLAFFCHGWRDGIQAGFRIANVRALAALIADHVAPNGNVILYACEAARDADDDQEDDLVGGPGGDGGFADELRDACETLGRRITVTGHASAGHCTWNPYVRAFGPGCHGRGGHWVVEPDSALWRPWVRALRASESSLRYRFWSMTAEAIREELAPLGGPLVA